MKGNSLCDFIDDLLTMGGPEKEFTFDGKTYMLETTFDSKTHLHEMVVFECSENNEEYIFRSVRKTLYECVADFENATVFNGKTFYEVEQNVEVLFG